MSVSVALAFHWSGRRTRLFFQTRPDSYDTPSLLRTQRSWLSVERLPGYAPDLNPAEQLWGNVKGQELANQCAENLKEVAAALRKGMARVRRRSSLAFSFLKHAGLSF